MPQYRLFVSFEVKPPDSSQFLQSYDEKLEFQDLMAAEKELESITSNMVSEFSNQGCQWMILQRFVGKSNDDKD